PVLGHHAPVPGVVLAAPGQLVPAEANAVAAAGGLEHAHALGHHFLADAVARNDRDAMFCHGRYRAGEAARVARAPPIGPGRRRTGAAARRSRYHGGVRALPYVLALALAGPAGGATAPAADAPAPAPFAARYEGHRFPLGARATLALARDGEYYKYSLRGAVYLGFFKGGEIYDCSVM